MHRLRNKRHSQRNAVSLSPSPKASALSETKRRHKEPPFISPEPGKRRTHRRPSTPHDTIADSEHPSIPLTTKSCPPDGGGLLCLKMRNGWTGHTRQCQSEDLEYLSDPGRKTPQKRHVSFQDDGDGIAELLLLKTEMMQLHTANVAKREFIVEQLQDLIKQRNNLYRDMYLLLPAESSSEAEIRVGDHSQEWILMEMDRLNAELEFKDRTAEILRTVLLKSRAQKTKLKSMSQFEATLSTPGQESEIHDSIKSVTEQQSDVQKKEVKELESEIAGLESHLKLLNDALEDEKQENYKIAKENILLKEKVDALKRQQKTS